MGGVCSSGTSIIQDHTEVVGTEFQGFTENPGRINGFFKQNHVPLSPHNGIHHEKSPSKHVVPKLPSTPRRTGASKIVEKSSIIGRTGTLNFKKAVQVLDTIGRSVPNLNAVGKEFVHGTVSKGNKISILAFEVANTIAKGANLLESLSVRNVNLLKEILRSEGVQRLVSTDMNLLLMIAAADKREEFDAFLKEVIRFGDLCKDPQWHKLDQYFPILGSNSLSLKVSKEDVEASMRELTALAQQTSELYHELNALDRFEHDYKQKLKEAKSFDLPQKGEDLAMLHDEVKHQRKLVNSLKKKSLWSKNMQEIMAKFVNVLLYIDQKFMEAFGNNSTTLLGENSGMDHSPQRLGPAGLALHYANIIIQIDTIASRPTCLPPNVRDSLYRSLPPSVKKALRSHLRVDSEKRQFTISRVKAEMDKTSKWLVPAAINTIKNHQKLGRVGDWASSRALLKLLENGGTAVPAVKKSGLRRKEQKKTASATSNEPIHLHTLYHADKEKTDLYILELVTWLHHLIFLAKQRVNAIAPFPLGSSTKRKPKIPITVQKFLPISYSVPKPMNNVKLSHENRDQSSPSMETISLTALTNPNVEELGLMDGLSEHS